MTQHRTLNDKILQDRIGFTPFPEQKEVLEGFIKNRDIRLAAGRRFGKSALCAYLCLRELLKDNRHIWIVAPNYDLTDKVFAYLVQWINKGFPELLRGVTTRIPAHILTPWGSWVKCKSTENPTSLLGEELNLAIVDEASRVRKNIWEAYVYPCLSTREGKSVMISTPFGKNFFYREWIRAKGDEDGFSKTYPSLINPYFPKKEWERTRKRLPEQVFKQEYQAVFLEDAASVFRGVRSLIADNCLKEPENHKYLLGVDLGKHEDFTVISVIDKYTHNIVHFERFKKIDWNLQKDRITSVSKKYNNARIIIDSTGLGDPISDDLKHRGLIVDDFRISGKSKQQLIDKLSIYIDQKAFNIPNNEVLIDELESYGYQMTDSGNIKYSAPEGMHDDCVISLALCIWGLFSPKKKHPSKIYREPIKKVKKFQYY